MKILLFQTNINCPTKKPLVDDCFKTFKGLLNWDVDFEDEYFTLRVIGSGISADEVIYSLKAAGFECAEIV